MRERKRRRRREKKAAVFCSLKGSRQPNTESSRRIREAIC